jgi:hypothetical protein
MARRPVHAQMVSYHRAHRRGYLAPSAQHRMNDAAGQIADELDHDIAIHNITGDGGDRTRGRR